MKKPDSIQRAYLQERWNRLLANNDVPNIIKTFLRKEKRWLRDAIARANKTPGGLGK